MNLRRAFVLAAVAGLLFPVGVVWADDDVYEPDRAIVRLAPGVDIAAINAAYGTAVVASVPGRRLYLLDLPDGEDEEDFAENLALDPRIELANVSFYALDPGPGTQSFYLASNFPAYETQYPRQTVGLPAAHGVATGAGVVVAVLDTGVDAGHPVLAGRVLGNVGYNAMTGGADTSDIGDGLDSDADGLIDEMVGHGTFVAGLLVAAAPGARIMPVKVMDADGRGTSFQVALGIDHAIRHGASVINLSLGTPGDNSVFEEMLRWAEEAGVVVVAAAMNNGNQTPAWSPAGVATALAVAATDATDHRADFSNYGEHIDLCAPGVDIVGTLPSGGFGMADGTSYACPLVAGAAALVIERWRGTPAETRQRLRSTATSLDALNPSYVGLLGAGRLNAAAAVGAGCRVDSDGDGVVNSSDISAFLAGWLARRSWTDLDGSGAINGLDISTFLQAWIDALADGC